MISKTLLAAAMAAGLLALFTPAHADYTSGPNPYDAGFGFDRPQEANWGGWRRGQRGTMWAEWDLFLDDSFGGPADRTAAPNVPAIGQIRNQSSHGLRNARLGWGESSFVTRAGNLYNLAADKSIFIAFRPRQDGPQGPVTVALQLETLGGRVDEGSFRLNGVAPARVEVTHANPAFPSQMGPTLLEHRLFVWNLGRLPQRKQLAFTARLHTSLRQVAIDIGPTRRP